MRATIEETAGRPYEMQILAFLDKNCRVWVVCRDLILPATTREENVVHVVRREMKKLGRDLECDFLSHRFWESDFLSPTFGSTVIFDFEGFEFVYWWLK